ncbi:DUF892 family protein [Mesorhizobium sp. ORM8.1]
MRRHIQETEGQITRLETVLEDLDEEHSTLKDTALSMLAAWLLPWDIREPATKSSRSAWRTSLRKRRDCRLQFAVGARRGRWLRGR